MMRFMNAVTDKPQWTRKVFNSTIVEKWRGEALNDGPVFETQMTERMFNYCIQELQHVAERHIDAPRGAVQVLHTDAGVYKSDTAVPEGTKLALQKAVAVLEDVPEEQKDWHPGSDGKVLDLVHPSLFPLVYGRTRVLPLGAKPTTLDGCIERSGEGDDDPQAAYDEATWSRKFQWLPADVDISGERPRILSYINNLHPQRHKKLYRLVEDVVEAAIPLWNLTLAPYASLYTAPRRIVYEECRYDPDPENNTPEPQREEGEDFASWGARVNLYWEWVQMTRKIVLPEPPEKFEPLPVPPPFSLHKRYGSKPLQVIVKLANIELTPEKPEYEGGTWHVEGKMVSASIFLLVIYADAFRKNEAIAATALYYYDSENITASTLAFRQLSEDFGFHNSPAYKQDHHDWLPAVFGLEQEGALIQNIGSVVTSEGKLVTFPNIIHHQVQPFKLVDPTKPGHRKLLALFLVDPNISIISTADVPCQRADWVDELVTGGDGMEISDERSSYPMSVDQAREYRKEFMEERKEFQLLHRRYSEDHGAISLCEH
ncbi:hypothetical protein FA13DRAFT_1756864 [Coprinellus micaceus]|uniref:Uncharacterized protein n=1 Tax=Coprinellus micaceus TaxID=71717 RepID=A0A4Y7SS24_COPMI|nr:hypothetical protein FA13DRAFT_1756864 [Coprinellus micaceus]